AAARNERRRAPDLGARAGATNLAPFAVRSALFGGLCRGKRRGSGRPRCSKRRAAARARGAPSLRALAASSPGGLFLPRLVEKRCRWLDLNQRHGAYETPALTN